ncbi:MAG: transposase [Deltaproteobacteria bacterium]|nr:transposase [Deltaproteobacteria bacterium]
MRELSYAEILAGDDTSCRVLEVTTHRAQVALGTAEIEPKAPPWADYATPEAAEKSIQRCEEARRARIHKRENGDRGARPTRSEVPTLGMRIARELGFEFKRRSGDGPKQAMHTTVISGRSVSEDPTSLIVLYRSHLGSCGDLFERLIRRRDPELPSLILQGDLSTTNLVTDPELKKRFDIRQIACASHARRPFALYEDEDPVHCEHMLHLFLGLAIHEERLDAIGRNQENVLAVRGGESRELWDEILELAKSMTECWSKATTLGTAARYIINHFDALTAYLDDARLEPTNNLRERMLRMEKLIEGSSMFRKSLEGRFVLDIVRTILQTAVAAGVPVHEYLVSVLRANEEEVTSNPSRFVPRAWLTEIMASQIVENSAPSS